MSETKASIIHEPANGGARIDHYTGIKMAMSPAESLRRMQELQAFIKEVMQPQLDYGVIPGTDKPTLFQPGAQKLAELYGFSHCFVIDDRIENWDIAAPLFVYRMKCVLTSRRDGSMVGEGVGLCNSREDRYAWRWTYENQMPAGVDRKTLRSKKTRKGDTLYRMPNEDIFSLVNTIYKMACKRAYVHAVLSVTRSSGIFNQDLEDLPEEVFGEAEESRSWESDDASKYDDPAIFGEKIKAAKNEAELKTIAGEIQKATLKKADEAALRKQWKARKDEVKPAAKPTAQKDEPPPAEGREPGDEG